MAGQVAYSSPVFGSRGDVVPLAALSNCWFALLLSRGFDGTFSRSNRMIEVEVRRGHAGDETRSAAESHVLKSPLNENQDAALALDNVRQVDERPHQPRRQTPKMYAENVGHRGRPSNDGKISFVEVIERSWLRFTFYFPHDRLCRVGSSLHGYLCHPLQRLAV